MKGLIEGIREKVLKGAYEYSEHALDQSVLRKISTAEVVEAVKSGEVIEDYPKDKYGPSCLILGWTIQGRPLHIQSSYPSRELVKIITVYEPDKDEWIDWKVRR